jgi:serine/threonine-protein kinase
MDSPKIKVPAKRKKIVIKTKEKNPKNRQKTINQDQKELKKDQERIGSERYTLKQKIGEGGAGKVYIAKHNLLETNIAIKLFNKELTNNREEVENIKNEAWIGIVLSNRYILKTHGFERNNETYFICMEYAQGGSLRDILNRFNSLALDKTKIIISSCFNAIRHAHHHEVIHGDLKPSNILVNQGIVKLADFGASAYKNKQGNYIRGTPEYMSLEQRQGKEIDEKTDIYSLGEIIYELLCGETRYPKNASLEDVLKTEPGEVEGLSKPISEVLKKATAEKKQERYSDIWKFRNSFFMAYDSLK